MVQTLKLMSSLFFGQWFLGKIYLNGIKFFTSHELDSAGAKWKRRYFMRWNLRFVFSLYWCRYLKD